jgi:hypothetical protein
VIFVFFAYPTPKKVSLKLLNTVSHMSRNGKNRHEIRREVGECTLDEGNLAPLDKYNFCQLAKRCSILTTISSQMDVALWRAPRGMPRYFKGKEEVPQPKIEANSATLSTLPTGTKRDLSKLNFKPETTSKQTSSTRRKRRWSGLASQKTNMLFPKKIIFMTLGI